MYVILDKEIAEVDPLQFEHVGCCSGVVARTCNPISMCFKSIASKFCFESTAGQHSFYLTIKEGEEFNPCEVYQKDSQYFVLLVYNQQITSTLDMSIYCLVDVEECEFDVPENDTWINGCSWDEIVRLDRVKFLGQ